VLCGDPAVRRDRIEHPRGTRWLPHGHLRPNSTPRGNPNLPLVRFSGHMVVNRVGYMIGMSYDQSTIATLRRALDEVLLDPRFYRRKSVSALEIAEHLLARAADGERDLERLKSSAFEKLTGNAQQSPSRAA
jgi:hypothetical protein